MNKLNENIFHQYNKWKKGYERKENSLQMRLDNFLSNKHSGVYHISEDGKHVDCDGTVIIWKSDLINGKLPFSFGKVKGSFKCSCKELTSLEEAAARLRGTAIHAGKQTDLEVAILSEQVRTLRDKNARATQMINESISILEKLKK